MADYEQFIDQRPESVTDEEMEHYLWFPELYVEMQQSSFDDERVCRSYDDTDTWPDLDYQYYIDVMLDEYADAVCPRCGQPCQWLPCCPADEAEEDAMVAAVEQRLESKAKARARRKGLRTRHDGFPSSQANRIARKFR